MAEAHTLQADFDKAQTILTQAEAVFPGEKLLADKRLWVQKQRKKSTQKEKQRFKKMFAKKKPAN